MRRTGSSTSSHRYSSVDAAGKCSLVAGFFLLRRSKPASAPLLALASADIPVMADPLRMRKSTTLMASQSDVAAPCTSATQTITWSVKCRPTGPLPLSPGTGSAATPETARKQPKPH